MTTVELLADVITRNVLVGRLQGNALAKIAAVAMKLT